MKIIRDYKNVGDYAKGCVIAIGNFDGLHIGHCKVIGRAIEIARAEGVPSAVMCFEPHPRRFFAPDSAPFMIEPFHVKARRLKALGVDYMFVLRFNEALCSMTAREFSRDVLCGSLSARHIVTGDNFTFGNGRGGDTTFLREESEKGLYGFSEVVIERVPSAGIICSSTAVRDFLKEGDIVSASRVLGRFYEMSGRVVRGDSRGREIGFPTANIIPHATLFPPALGVYLVQFAVMDNPNYDDYSLLRLGIAGERAANSNNNGINWCNGVANFGVRPTFAGDRPRLEVHGLDFDEDIYGKYLRVRWLRMVRFEKKFNSINELRRQIEEDISHARDWFNNIGGMKISDMIAID